MTAFAGISRALLVSCVLHLLIFWPTVREGVQGLGKPLSGFLRQPQPMPQIPVATASQPERPRPESAIPQPLSQPQAAVVTPYEAPPTQALPTQGAGLDPAGVRQYR